MASQLAGEPAAGTRLTVLLQLPDLVRQALRLVRAAAPRLSLASTALQVVGAVALGAQVLLARRLLVTLIEGAPAGGHHTYVLILGLTAVTLVASAASIARYEIQPLLGEKVTRYSLERVIEISASVDLQSLEDPKYHDRLQRALINAGHRSLQLTSGLSSLMGSLVSGVVVAVTLVYIQPLLFFAAVAAGVPAFVTTIRASRALYRFTFDQTATDRQRIYLQSLLTLREPAKDVRSYALGRYLGRRYRDLYARRIEALTSVVTARVRRGLLSSAATAILSGGALALVVVLVQTHRMSLASAGAASAALVLLGVQLRALAGGTGALYESSLYMRDFTDFLSTRHDVENDPGTAVAPQDFREVRLEGIEFRYPNTAVPALTDISMSIPAGKVIALVGENGSGKTTLAKLLAGLYSPQQGRVTWDGVDASTFTRASLRDAVAVLFQDFSQFATTARENIAWGRWEDDGDTEAVANAATRAGAWDFIQRLSDQLDTQIGPEFAGGVELSGGQWQRVALARAVFRNAPLVILDEPTAALDPAAEAALFEKLRDVFAGRTVVMVSHRMATVRTADYIYVLHEGRVHEEGTHDELMERRGAYSLMFSVQRDFYL